MLFNYRQNVDVFIHSWDTKYENEIVNTYNPKKHKFQEQIIFNEDNVRQHFIESRWFGAKQVNNLKSEYEKENGFTYDVVMWSRFDVGFFTDLIGFILLVPFTRSVIFSLIFKNKSQTKMNQEDGAIDGEIIDQKKDEL